MASRTRAALLQCAAVACFLLSSVAGKQTRPNIILIVADDLGYGDLGVHGAPTIRTPNLDQLAQQGTRFTQFYVGGPICTPSRSSMLTGRLPVRDGIYSDLDPPADELFRVFYPSSVGCLDPDSHKTVTEYLKEAGYMTAMVGKWHLGHNNETGCLPGDGRQGFEFFYGMPYSHEEGYPGPAPEGVIWPPVPLILNDFIVEQPYNETDLTSRYTATTVQLIEQFAANKKDDDDAFFIHVAYENPHVPLFVGPEFEGVSRRGKFGDSVEEMDDSIGQVMAALQQTGLEEDTMVIFFSDNPAWISPNSGVDTPGNINSGIEYVDGGSNAPFFDGKGSTWEGGIRSAMLMRYPGVVPAGRVSMEVWWALDLLPTLAEMVGFQLDDDIVVDGISVADMLTGASDESPHDFLYIWRERDLYAVRYGPYKAHYITRSGFNSSDNGETHHPPLLFQIEHDPGELYPLDPNEYADVIETIDQAAANHLATIEKADSVYLRQDWSLVPCCDRNDVEPKDLVEYIKNHEWGLVIWDQCVCVRPSLEEDPHSQPALVDDTVQSAIDATVSSYFSTKKV